MTEKVEQEVLEGNKIIAKFMGIETKVYNDTPTVTRWNFNGFMRLEEDIKYHSSWDWLMPVGEKIESIEFENGLPKYEVIIFKHCCYIERRHNEIMEDFIQVTGQSTKIEAVWLAVVEFIKWYNQNQK